MKKSDEGTQKRHRQSRRWRRFAFLLLVMQLVALLCSEAFADVVVRGSSITASGAAGASGATQAMDDNPDTRWEADSAAAGQWLAMSFQTPALLRAIRVSEPRPRIRGWRIEVLGRGVWQPVLSGIGIPRDKIVLPPTWAEGVRIVTASPSDGPPAISEFAAWGSGTSACMPQPGTPSVTVVGDLDCAGLTLSQPCGKAGPVAPLFVLADGARLRNTTLIDSYVSCDGACTLENVNWRNNCPTLIQQSVVIQAYSDQGGKDINVIGGSAFGRFGALFRLNMPDSTLNLRQFVFSGYAESINGYPVEMASNLRYRLDEVSLAGAIRGAVIQVRVHKGDKASIRRLRIAAYRPGSPLVCNGLKVEREHLLSLGEQWQSDACDVGPDDVKAAPG